MIDKEKVRELVNRIHDEPTQRYRVEILEKWLEQNQPVVLSENDAFNLAAFLQASYDVPHSIEYIQDDILEWQGDRKVVEPVVVGLTDKQVGQLSHEVFQFIEEFYAESSDIPFASEIKRFVTRWLSHEDFTQEVKEISVGLTDKQIMELARFIEKDNSCRLGVIMDNTARIKTYLTTQTFTQPEVKEVVVGLSDEQIADFGAFVYGFDKPAQKLEGMLKDWHDRQTFTQPEAKEVVVGLSGEQVDGLINYLKGEGILQDRMNHAWKIRDYLNTQDFTQPEQFKPDWSKIPADSTIDGCKIDLVWTCCGGLIERETLAHFERPKPAPEVGQVWRLRDVEGYVIESVINDIVRYKVEANGSMMVSERTLSDFLDKFEQAENKND